MFRVTLSRVTTVAGVGNFRGRAFARNVKILVLLIINMSA
jgi:hypothetical protein